MERVAEGEAISSMEHARQYSEQMGKGLVQHEYRKLARDVVEMGVPAGGKVLDIGTGRQVDLWLGDRRAGRRAAHPAPGLARVRFPGRHGGGVCAGQPPLGRVWPGHRGAPGTVWRR